MKTSLFTRIIPFLLCLCCFSVVPSRLYSQTAVLSQSFKNLNAESSYTSISSYDGWTFENCYAAGDNHYLQVGSGSSPYKLGSVTSPALGVEGNVVVLIKTGYIVSGAKFRVSVEGTGTVASTEYTVVSGDSYRPSAILIKGCLPSTCIVIEGTSGKFYLRTMKAFAVSDAIFYESFDYFEYKNSGFAYSSDNADVSQCDNYTNVEFVNTKLANKKIFFDNTGHFTFPTLYADEDTKAMLTFRTALFGSNKHYLNITASDGVKMTSLDDNDISSLESAYNGELTGNTNTWQEHSIILTGLNNTSSIKIEGRDIFLDDVKLTPIPDGLDQSKDNSTYILANAGKERTVTLTRSLTPDVWCPLCLPFDVTPALMASVAGTCELRTFSSVDTSTGIFKFNSVEGETTIEAGTPFLIKTSALVTNPTFAGMTIKNVNPVSYSNGDYQFVGVYSPTYLKTDGTNLFLGTDGNLYKPGSEEGYNRLGGMRAYFVVPAGASARVAIFDEPDLTGIDEVVRKQNSSMMFDLLGCPVSKKLPRGIVISNGRKWISK